MATPITFAQISDLHLDGGDRAYRRAEAVLAYLAPRPLAALLVTGDIADHGEPAEYVAARSLLSLPYPVLPCPGNHDRRPAYRTAFLGEPADGSPVNRLHTVDGTTFVLLDSSIPGRDDGRLTGDTLDWLESTLDTLPTGTPTFVCFHHPRRPWVCPMWTLFASSRPDAWSASS